jgi:hypothetical protein
VPNAPAAQATFGSNGFGTPGGGNRGPITLSANADVGTLTFTHVNAPGYTFDFSTATLFIFSGIGTNVNPPTFDVTGTGSLQFINASAGAGNAIINMSGGTGGSPTQFFGTSTAANADITVSNGSALNFWDSAEQATRQLPSIMAVRHFFTISLQTPPCF